MTWQAASGAPVELSHGHDGAAGLPQHGGIAVRALVDGAQLSAWPQHHLAQRLCRPPASRMLLASRTCSSPHRPRSSSSCAQITAPASPASIKPNTATPAYPPSMPYLPRWPERPPRPAAVTLATGSTPAVCQSPTVIGALAGRVSCRRILARLRSGRLSVTRAQIRCFGARDLSGLAWKQPPPANW
jgi:hypothetical protein